MNIRGCRDIRNGGGEREEEGVARLDVDASFEVNSRKAKREKCGECNARARQVRVSVEWVRERTKTVITRGLRLLC